MNGFRKRVLLLAALAGAGAMGAQVRTPQQAPPQPPMVGQEAPPVASRPHVLHAQAPALTPVQMDAPMAVKEPAKMPAVPASVRLGNIATPVMPALANPGPTAPVNRPVTGQADAPETVAEAQAAAANAAEAAKYEKARQDFNIWVFDFNRRIYERQSAYSLFIFLMVNALVLSGLFFAWVQFKTTLHVSQHVQAQTAIAVAGADGVAAAPVVVPVVSDPAAAAAAMPESDFSFGKDGIAIKSSFIGLIILGFSMAFYLMYLQYVYPIRSADQPPTATQSTSAQ